MGTVEKLTLKNWYSLWNLVAQN